MLQLLASVYPGLVSPVGVVGILCCSRSVERKRHDSRLVRWFLLFCAVLSNRLRSWLLFGVSVFFLLHILGILLDSGYV